MALGGSAGGLLMGAVANLAPHLFVGNPGAGAVRGSADHDPRSVAAADGDEWDEWGNPLENKDVYFYMKSDSPDEMLRPRNIRPSWR